MIGQESYLSTTVAGLIITTAQMGYDLGLVFLFPIRNLLERRKRISLMDTLTTLALA